MKTFNFKALEAERLKWSLETFKEATPMSSLVKAQEEISEIKKDLINLRPNPEEYADAIMCILDSAGRIGISFDQIMEAYAKKIEINKNRKWIKNRNNTYSHIKEKL